LFSFTFIERMFLCVPVCLLCIVCVCVCVCVFSATTSFCGELEFIYHREYREYREACWATALFSRTVKQWRDRVWGTGAPAPVDSTTATKTEWVVVVVESKRAAGSPAPDTRSRHCFAALGEHDGGIKTDDEASHVVISPRHATASLHAAIAATTRSDHTHIAQPAQPRPAPTRCTAAADIRSLSSSPPPLRPFAIVWLCEELTNGAEHNFCANANKFEQK